MNLKFWKKPAPKPPEVIEEKEEEEERRIIPYFLETHPAVIRITIPSVHGKPQDVLIWCEGRAQPFSVVQLITHSYSRLGFLDASMREFAKCSKSVFYEEEKDLYSEEDNL